jgi:trimeric autotransporter adhesin
LVLATILGSAASDVLFGTPLADEIYGLDAADSISGLGGKDTLFGGAGADTLDGGVGDDALDGGTGVDSLSGNDGDDVYFVDDSADVVVESSGEGYDTVFARANTTLSANIEQLIISGPATSGTGNSSDNSIIGSGSINSLVLDGAAGNDVVVGSDQSDTLRGGSGNDVLLGLGGSNRLEGGAGDDVIYSASSLDTIVENANGGFDTLYVNYNVTSLATDVEQLILNGAAVVGNGNSGNNTIIGSLSGNSLSLDGGDGNDWIVGSNQSDTIAGGAGNDVIEGLGGSNVMAGGAGDDFYFSTSETDSVTEVGGGGFDTMYSNHNVALLGDQVELLIVYGAAVIGNGNSGDNTIIGSISANGLVLDGAAGNDAVVGSDQSDTLLGGSGNDLLLGLGGSNRLEGGAGDDIIISTSSLDTIIENANGGFDTVYSDHDVIALAADVEQLVVYGAAVVGNGNSGNNTIIGSLSANSLSLDGGGGNDVIIGSNQADTGLGGEGADVLYGLGGADSLSGGDGYDDLIGGAGADALDGGAGLNRAWYIHSATGVDVSLATGLGHGGEAEGDVLVNITDLVGSQQGDVLTGDGADNTFFGLDGSDDLRGGGGADSLLGGAGGDALDGGAGSDALYGEAGDDSLVTALNAGDTDFLFAGEGSETKGDIAVVDGNTDINTYLVGGNGQGFVYVGTGAEAGENAANVFITDAETLQLVTSSTSDDVEIADGIGAAGTNAMLVEVAEGDDTVTVTASANTGLSFLQVLLGDGSDSFDFSHLDATTDVATDGGAGDDSFQLHAGAADITFDFAGSGGNFGNDAVSGIGANDLLIFSKGSANAFNVIESLVNGNHLLTVEADGVTVGTVNVSGTFDFATNVVII